MKQRSISFLQISNHSYLRRQFLTFFLIICIQELIQLVNCDDCNEIQGCIKCTQNIDTSIICQQCSQDYLLDSNSNICIYTKCSNNLYYQPQDNLSLASDNCVAICGDSYSANKTTRLCDKINDCSSYTTSTNNLFLESSIKQVFVDTDNIMHLMYEGMVTLVRSDSGIVYKTVNYNENYVIIQMLNGRIFLGMNDNTIYYWNIVLSSQTLIYTLPNGNNLTSSSQLSLISNQVVCLILNDLTSQKIEIIPISHLDITAYLQVTSKLEFKYKSNDVQIYDDLLFQNDQNGLNIYKIVYDDQQKALVFLQSILCTPFQSTLNTFFNFNNDDSYIITEGINVNSFFFISFKLKQCKKILMPNPAQIIIKIQSLTINLNEKQLVTLISFAGGIQIFSNSFVPIQTIAINLLSDFCVGSLDRQMQQLIMLIDYQQLVIYSFNDKKQIFEMFDQTSLYFKSSSGIIQINTFDEQNLLNSNGVILQSQKNFEIIKRTQIQQQLYSSLLSNYNKPFPYLIKNPVKLLLIEKQSLLISCNQSGIIAIYDVSSGYDQKLYQSILFQGQQCIDIQNIGHIQVLVQLSQQIVIIDIFTGFIVKTYQLNPTSEQVGAISISVDGSYSLMAYNKCLEIYDNNTFLQVFKNCNTELISSNNIKIKLLANLKIIIQKNISFIFYKLTLQDSSYTKQESYISQSVILNKKIILQQVGDIYSNSFEIDEILIFDASSKIIILQNDLSIKDQLSLQFNSIYDLNRVKNDNNQYVVMIPFNYNDQYYYRLALISRSSGLTQTYLYTGFFYSNQIMEAVKIVYDDGTAYYVVRHYINFVIINILFDVAFPAISSNQNVGYLSGLYYNFGSQAVGTTQFQPKDNRNLNYLANQIGQVSVYDSPYKRYDRIDISQYLTQQGDAIVNVIQSPFMNKYFVQTNYQILIFDIFKDEKILNISFTQQQNIIKFRVFNSLNAIIYSQLTSIYIRYFIDQTQYKEYSYSLSNIKDWVYSKDDKLVYVYGNGLISLDLNFNPNQILVQKDTLSIDKCNVLQSQIICKLTTATLIFIDKKTPTNIQTINIQGFTSNTFMMEIDTQFNNLFLIESFIQIYTLKGVFKKSINFRTEGINVISIEPDLVIFRSPKFLFCYSRQDVNLLSFTISPSSQNIIKHIYIQQYYQIIFTCDTSLFAQVFIFDIKSQQIVSQITTLFTGNGLGNVVEISFNIVNTKFLFLDEFGNLNFHALYGSYQIQNLVKIYDILNRKEKPLGYSEDEYTGNVLVYTSNSIYKVSYITLDDKYEMPQYSQKNLYVIIQKEQQNGSDSQFLVLSSDNIILRYQEYQLVYEVNFNQNVIFMKYIALSKTLIFAFADHIEIVFNYKYGDRQSFKNTKKTETFSFQKFIDDDLFLTFDNKMIHYDFINIVTKQEIPMPKQNLITQIYSHSTQPIVILGFHSGDIMIYNKTKQTFQMIDSLKNFQSDTYLKSIKFIEEYESDTILISTIQGDVMLLNLLDLTKYQIFSIQLQLNLNPQTFKILNCFVYDFKNKNIIFFFFQSAQGFVWSLNEKKSIGYIISPQKQNNHIELSNNFILSRCSTSINFYSRDNKLQLLGYLHFTSFSFTIKKIILINDQFIFIAFQDSIQVILFQGKTSRLVYIEYINYTEILEFTSSLDSKGIFRILVLKDTGVIEIKVSTQNYISSNNSQCSFIVNTILSYQLEQQIKQVQPVQLEIQQIGEKGVNPSKDQTLNLFIKTDSHLLPLLNSVFQTLVSQYKIKLLLSSNNNDDNDIEMHKYIFSSLTQNEWNLINFSLKLSQTCNNSLECKQIGFDPKTKYVSWQNIEISQIPNLRKIKINFINMTEVTITDLTISFNTDTSDSSLRNLEQADNIDNEEDCLLYFENVERVFIYKLVIINNSQLSNNKYNFISMKSVSQLTIKGLQIQDNTNIISFIKFILVNEISMENLMFKSNKNQMIEQQVSDIFIFNTCNTVQINGLEFINNEGCILIQSSNKYEQLDQVIINKQDKFVISSSTLQNNTNSLYSLIELEGSYIEFTDFKILDNMNNIKLINPIKVDITTCEFRNNTSQNGGGVYIFGLKSKMEIQNTLFSLNKARGSGGGIYFEDLYTQNVILDDKTQITKNIALIGGGIRIVNKISSVDLPISYPFSQQIFANTADIYGNNACTFVQHIQVFDNNLSNIQTSTDPFNNLSQYGFMYNINSMNENDQYYGKIELTRFKSGGNLQLNIYLLDNDMRKVTFQREKILKQIYPQDIIDELSYLSIQTDVGKSLNIQLLGEIILNQNMYNQDLYCFQFGFLTITSQPKITNEISLNFYFNQFTKKIVKVEVQIQFRECLLAEVLTQPQPSVQLQICLFCSEGSYSLVDPNLSTSLASSNSLTSQECKKCPFNAIKCFGNKILLKNGFWRKNQTTDEIIQCTPTLNSCQAENSKSNQDGCTEGYLGPLCEECDTKGQIWGKNTSDRYVSQFYSKECKKCNDIAYQYVFFGIQVVLMLFYFIYNSLKFVVNFKHTLTCYYLRKLNLVPISKTSNANQSSSYIKIIVTYLQFSSLLIIQPSVVPIQMNIIPSFVGSSSKLIVLSISCIIPLHAFQYLGKALTFTISNISIPLIFLVCTFILLNSITITSLTKNHKKYLNYSMINIIYTFFLVDIVSFYTLMLTCRHIGTDDYHALDLLKKCNDPELKSFIYPFAATILSLWCFSPLILFYYLRKNRNNLELCKVKLVFGYFYHEFDLRQYYWEFVRLYLKIFIIISYTLLRQDHLMFARAITALVFSSYTKSVESKKPFTSSEFTRTEILSYQILIIKMILAAFIEEIQFANTFFELLLYLIDYLLVLHIALNYLKLFLTDQNSIIVKLFIKVLSKTCPNVYSNFQKYNTVRFITYIRWKFIRYNIRNIIALKTTEHLNLVQESSLQKTEIQQTPKGQKTQTLLNHRGSLVINSITHCSPRSILLENAHQQSSQIAAKIQKSIFNLHAKLKSSNISNLSSSSNIIKSDRDEKANDLKEMNFVFQTQLK